MSGNPILRSLAIAASAALLVTALAVPAAAKTVSGTVNDNVKGEDIVVTGRIEGNVIERKTGSVIVDGGVVTGNISENGDGDIRVINGGKVHGNVIEKGDGDVVVDGSAVGGNVKEKGPGDIWVSGSTIGGKVKERGPGEVIDGPPPLEYRDICEANDGEYSEPTGYLICLKVGSLGDVLTSVCTSLDGAPLDVYSFGPAGQTAVRYTCHLPGSHPPPPSVEWSPDGPYLAIG